MKPLLFIAVLFLACPALAQKKPLGVVDSLEQTVKDIKQEISKIRENYYVITPYGLAGNVAVFVSRDHVVIVDDQWTTLSKRIKEMVKSVTDKPIRYVINSHFHYDHVDGNRAFGKENVSIVAHANVRERLSKDHHFAGNSIQKAHPNDVLPGITYSHTLNLEHPDETIELVHVKNAHTDGDTFIHFKRGNIIHTGDVFVRYGLPFIDENGGGDVYGMIEAADYLIRNSNAETKIIPGHGAVSTVEDVIAFRDLLVMIRDHVRRLYREGASMDKIIAEVKIDERIGGVDQPSFVGHVYRMVQKHEK